MFQKLWIQSALYRRIIHKLYGIQNKSSKLKFPIGILGDFNVHYLVYDNIGNVLSGHKTLREAVSNKQNNGVTVLYE